MNSVKTICHSGMIAERTLSESMPQELLEAIQKPGAAEIVKEWAENTLRHHENPLYTQAAEAWRQVQANQINKGAAKYPETLNPRSWSLDQLIDHAMEECVDQFHYLTAMRQKSDYMSRCLTLFEKADAALEKIVRSDNFDQALQAAAEYCVFKDNNYQSGKKNQDGKGR